MTYILPSFLPEKLEKHDVSKETSFNPNILLLVFSFSNEPKRSSNGHALIFQHVHIPFIKFYRSRENETITSLQNHYFLFCYFISCALSLANKLNTFLAGSWENDIGINEIVMSKEFLIQLGGESKHCGDM